MRACSRTNVYGLWQLEYTYRIGGDLVSPHTMNQQTIVRYCRLLHDQSYIGRGNECIQNDLCVRNEIQAYLPLISCESSSIVWNFTPKLINLGSGMVVCGYNPYSD